MHVGHSYPFLWEFWSAECFFWPGFVPRKIFIRVDVGSGTGWASLSTGVVTDVGAPSLTIAGDVLWTFTTADGLWDGEILLHKVATLPNKQYTCTVRLEDHFGNNAFTFAELTSPYFNFGIPLFLLANNNPPYSNGVPPIFTIRAATWGEV